MAGVGVSPGEFGPPAEGGEVRVSPLDRDAAGDVKRGRDAPEH